MVHKPAQLTEEEPRYTVSYTNNFGDVFWADGSDDWARRCEAAHHFTEAEADALIQEQRQIVRHPANLRKEIV